MADDRISPREIITGIAFLASVSVGTWWACTTSITVPAIWPLAATLTAIGAITYAVLQDRTIRAIHAADRAAAEQQPEAMTVWTALDGPGAERIGDAHRDAVLNLLGQHLAAGRLTPDEHDHRQTAALNAVTRTDLRATLHQLPHH